MTYCHASSLLFGLLSVATSQAIELRLDPNSSAPPSFVFDASQDARTLTISLHNDDGMPIGLGGAQLTLALEAGADAQGDLAANDFSLPAGSLFEGSAPPLTQETGEGTSASVNAFPLGPVIDANATGDLYTVTVTGFESAEGGFRIFANPSMPDNLAASSHWIDLSGPFGTPGFTNPIDPETGRLLLGTITVLQVPEGAAGTLALLAFTGAHGLRSRRLGSHPLSSRASLA